MRESKICAVLAVTLVAAATTLPADAPSPARSGSAAVELSQQIDQLYKAGKYSEALPLALKHLELCEKTLGPEYPETATSLNGLAVLYRAMDDYAKAEPLFQRALKIREKALGPEHPDKIGRATGRERV